MIEPIPLSANDTTTPAGTPPSKEKGNDLDDTRFNWTFYPNPANGSINITLDQARHAGDEAWIEVFNMLGRLVVSKKLTRTTYGATTLDLSTTELLPGVYAVRVTTAGQHKSRLITIDR